MFPETPSDYRQNKHIHKYNFLKSTPALNYETFAHRQLLISPNNHTHVHIHINAHSNTHERIISHKHKHIHGDSNLLS